MTRTDEFRILGRRPGNEESIRFEYRGVVFDQDSFHVVAGLNAVDTREYVEQTFAALKAAGQPCARMGAYKPRTSPYSFQGLGKQGLEILAQARAETCLLYTSPSPRDRTRSRMPSSA